MNRGGFSWWRLFGISAAKARISRAIGIPLTKSGREQKVGRLILRGGCLASFVVRIVIPICVVTHALYQ